MEDENVLHSENNLWEEIFICLSKVKSLTDNYSEKKYNNNKFPLSKLFHKIIQPNFDQEDILVEFEKIIKKLKIKKDKDILSSSNKLLNFLLYGLHIESIFNNNEKKNFNNINSNNKLEYFENEEEAYNFFQSKNNNNVSYIQKNFFGIKKINKYCKICGKNSFAFNHFKFFPLDLSDLNSSANLISIKKSIHRKFEKKMFCNYCKKKRDFSINIEIIELPKYLIVLIYNYQNNDIEIEFLDDNLYDNYKLKSFIIKKDKSQFKKIIQLFKCEKNDNKEYKSFWVERNKIFSYNNMNEKKYYQNEDIKEKPYFIMYKKENERDSDKKPVIKKISEGSESRLIYDDPDIPKKGSSSSKKSFIFCNKKKENKIEEKYNEVNNIENDNENENENKNDKDVEDIAKNKIDEKIKIRLYFKYKTKRGIYFIDTENYKTFEIILKELNNIFGLSDLDKIKLRFRDKEINKSKTPNYYNILHGSYIYILQNS